MLESKRSDFKSNLIRILQVILFIILSIVLLQSMSMSIFATDDSELIINKYEENKICKATIDDDFTDDIILVSLTQEATFSFNNYTIKDFPELELTNVFEMTEEFTKMAKEQTNYEKQGNAILDNTTNKIDFNKFRRILKLELAKPSKQAVLDAIEILEKRYDIRSAEPNYIGEFTTRIPNDPYRNNQWALNYLQLPNAWTISSGDVSVRVGIADSGIDNNHPDLMDRINTVLSRDFTGGGNPWFTNNVHGTHVAGIVGAAGNNARGIVGVNWNVELVSLKVGDHFPTSEGVADALLYAGNDKNGIRVVNLSLSIQESTAVNDAINAFNGIIICAAGNGGNDTVSYPAKVNNPRIISVGSLESDGRRSSYSNWGKVDIWAPGGNILSTIPNGNTPIGYRRHSDGYAYTDGTSMAAPYVAGIAALMLSVDPDLTTNQLRMGIVDAGNIINISHPSGILGLGSKTISVRSLNAYNTVKYVLENFSNTTYTLSNYSNSIDTNKTIAAGNTYFNKKNGFYKLNVTNENKYEFKISSTKALDVVLYDKDFNELDIKDLYSGSLQTHIIKNLSVGTYYLRTSYKNENDTGTINTKIVSRNTVYLNYNHNDILVNTYNGVNEYYYNNTKGAGFYEFRLTGTNTDGNITYPTGAITMYSDSGKSICMDKFSLSGYSNQARTKLNDNSMIVYLPRNGYFYIGINMPSNNLTSLFLDITSLSASQINLFDFSETANESVNIFNETSKGDYFEMIDIEQSGRFNICYNYNGFQNDNILFVLAKRVYNSSSNSYSLDIKITRLTNKTNNSFSYTDILEDGVYYLGYFNKDDTSSFSVNFERIVTQSGGHVLETDPGLGTPSGSQINIIEMNNS